MSSGEKKHRNKRITVYVSDYYYEVIDELQGHCGNSNSSVVDYIIRNWIIDNSKKIVGDFEINLAKIRRKYYPNLRDISIKKDLDVNKKNLIEKLPQLLRRVSSFKVIKLADRLEVNPEDIEDLFLYHSKDIEDITELDLILEDDKIKNNSI